jgi:hypothetical protein
VRKESDAPAGRARLVQWGGRGLAALLALVGSLAVCELALRLFMSEQVTSTLLRHERWQYRNMPGAQHMFKHTAANGGQSILLAINSQGFRGDELVKDARPRVIVYGDSYIESYRTAAEGTFSVQLGAKLGAQAINAGTSGYGPDEMSARMEDELAGVGASLVVVSIYSGNDFGDLLRDKMYRLDAQGEAAPSPWVLGKDIQARFAEAGTSLRLWRMLAKVRSRAPRKGPGGDAHAVTLDKAVQLSTQEYEEYVVHGDNVVKNLFFDYFNADVALTPASESAKYRVRLMEAVLRRIQRTAERAHVPLLLMIVPDPIAVCDSYDGNDVDAAKYPDYKRSTLTDAVEGIAVRNGIKHVNLFTPFREGKPETLFFRAGNAHWNEAGQRLAAEIVARYVTENKLLPAAR